LPVIWSAVASVGAMTASIMPLLVREVRVPLASRMAVALPASP